MTQAPEERVDEIATELAEDLRRSIPIRGIAKHYAQLEAENEHMAQVVKAARGVLGMMQRRGIDNIWGEELESAITLLDQEPSESG